MAEGSGQTVSAQSGWGLWTVRLVTQAVATVILQKIIVASGLLDPYTNRAGGWVSENVGLTGWVLAFVIGVPVTALVTTLVTRWITPAPTPIAALPAGRDMTFRDALRHFAYKSRWAHEFEHPTGDWMTAVRWPQAVHKEFCQPLIDDALIAWGIRREPGKPAENGHTKISADFWRTAQFEVEYALEDPDRTGWAKDVEGVFYSRVMLNRSQVEALWPPIESDGVSKIEMAAKEWWRLRQIDVGQSQTEMAEMVSQSRQSVKRDATLSEGLLYSLTGRWGRDQQVDAYDLDDRLKEFEKAAKADDLTVWGTEIVAGISFDDDWEQIAPDFWKTHQVKLLTVAVGENAQTEPRRGGTLENQYERLMVSKAQFEDRWPHEQ